MLVVIADRISLSKEEREEKSGIFEPLLFSLFLKNFFFSVVSKQIFLSCGSL